MHIQYFCKISHVVRLQTDWSAYVTASRLLFNGCCFMVWQNCKHKSCGKLNIKGRLFRQFLCRLRSIAKHRDHFVRRLSVCLSVLPSIRLSVRLSHFCHTFQAGDTCIPRNAATIFVTNKWFLHHFIFRTFCLTDPKTGPIRGCLAVWRGWPVGLLQGGKAKEWQVSPYISNIFTHVVPSL